MYIEENNFLEAYQKLCKSLIVEGEPTNPRDLATKEIQNVMVHIKNPRSRIMNYRSRKIAYSFAIGEWLWCMQGREDLNMIKYYAPSYNRFSDDGLILNGAYGPRILRGINKIIQLLKEDPNSRRAVIPIYDKKDVGLNSKDIPCTISLQFFIRKGKLNMITSMRSNDIFLGFPYDVFNFTMFQEYIATCLGVDVGTYTHCVGSLHYYLTNEEKIKNISEEKLVDEEPMDRMPREELEYQLHLLYSFEEFLRNSSEIVDVSNFYDSMNPYFKRLGSFLLSYHKKIRN